MNQWLAVGVNKGEPRPIGLPSVGGGWSPRCIPRPPGPPSPK